MGKLNQRYLEQMVSQLKPTNSIKKSYANGKRRFQIKKNKDDRWIRATYGHSLKFVDKDLIAKQTDPNKSAPLRKSKMFSDMSWLSGIFKTKQKMNLTHGS